VFVGVVRSDDGSLPVSVDMASSDLTATHNIDYAGVTNRLELPSTGRIKVVSVPILNNDQKDTERSFVLTLSNPTGTMLGPFRQTTIRILDNDQIGFQFGAATNTVAEDAGVALITVLRGTDDTKASVTVDYAAFGLTATNGLDYLATSGTLSFAQGDKAKVVAIPILNNGVNQATRSFMLTLSNPAGGAVLGSRTTTTVRILDNDPGVGFELNRYENSWGQAGLVNLTVLRGNDGALGPFSVDYATSDGSAKAGKDYRAVAGKLEFQANVTVTTLSIPLLRDRAAGSFRVTLSNPTAGAALGTAATTVSIGGSYYELAPPFDEVLAINRDYGVNLLTWMGDGKLQRADRVTGPWQTLAAAQSPFNVEPPIPATFYRVLPPRPAKLYPLHLRWSNLDAPGDLPARAGRNWGRARRLRATPPPGGRAWVPVLLSRCDSGSGHRTRLASALHECG
jgi:hypothetical protein